MNCLGATQVPHLYFLDSLMLCFIPYLCLLSHALDKDGAIAKQILTALSLILWLLSFTPQHRTNWDV